MTKRRAILLLLCLMLLPCLALGDALPRSSFRGHVPPPDVPEGERVPPSYFEDAVFVGDSIMASLELHGMFRGSRYATAIGIGPQNAMGRVFDTYLGEKTLAEVVEMGECSKIYVLLGANTIGNSDDGPAAERYADFLSRLVAAYPDKLIYVISIPPRVRVPMGKKVIPPLERIARFNAAIRDMCAAHGIYYLDIFSPMIKEDGQVDGSFLAGDGMHLSRKGSGMLEEHFMTHAVQEMP